ncbi:zf-CW domain-containing protein [Cephalotus follicularis]|uniref:Zf-CW domain-containing protein n=1 Tax=Cephalotus follicularis TaxID=3775 RepID=A0A1Q3BZ32_CEPFO|nr:zf-CW domain-containing protein [Cephalotus follicularis]
MDENSELEEGEAYCYQDNDDNNIDPDIALSYIDDKLQNVLGHFQKDFEGGLSVENLGAKFGGYGSFLPAYERSSYIFSCPKTPHSKSSNTRSPENFRMEGASQNLKATSNAPPSVRRGTTICTSQLLHNSGMPSGDVSVTQDSRLYSAKVAGNLSLKDESLKKLSTTADQRTLKVRIKVSSTNNLAIKTAAIYSGLGLDDSPSSSLGNSQEDSGGMPPVSRETACGSPTSILQIMTSFPVPGGAVISPLHDSLLCLVRRECLSSDSKPVPSIRFSQEHSAMTAEDLDSVLGNGKLSKERKISLVGIERPVESNHQNGPNEKDDVSFRMKRFEETPAGKGIVSSYMTQMPSTNSVYFSDSVKATVKASEVRREVSKDTRGEILFSSDSVKEDSLESISGQDSGKNEMRNAYGGLVAKVQEKRMEKSSKDVDTADDGRCNGNNKTRAPVKAYSDISKCKEDPNIREITLSNQKTIQKPASRSDNEIKIPIRNDKPLLLAKKKLKGVQTGAEAATVLIKESLGFGVGMPPKDASNSSKSVSTSKSKVHKLKLQKNISKVRDNHSDFSDPNFGQPHNHVDLFQRPSGHRPKDSSLDEFGIEHDAFFNTMKDTDGKKVNKQPISEASVRYFQSVTENGVANRLVSEMEPQAVDQPFENWVCCDSCQKWRLLPFGANPDLLPDKWLCSMLNWLPGMNRCDISQDETTKALYASYHQPVEEGHSYLQNFGNGMASGITSAHVQHLGQHHQRVNSDAVPIRGKKKHGLREEKKSGGSSGPIQTSNSTMKHLQESVKSKSLNDKIQPPAKSNLMKSTSCSLSKPHSLVLENQTTKVKEDLNGGSAKQIKMILKREADQYRFDSSKKSRIDNRFPADEHRKSDMDLGRMDLNSSVGLPTNASGKSMGKRYECSLSEDAKYDMKDEVPVSRKKVGDQPQASSDGGSLDIKNSDKRSTCVKKRKLKERPDSKACVNEEISESIFRKGTKYRVLKMEGKESSAHNTDGRSNKRVMVSQIRSSGSRDHPVEGMKGVKNIDKGQQLHKQRKKFVSKQTLDGSEIVRRDFGCGQVTMASTSSSSKVEEVKASPMESVSSSPVRTSYPNKLASAGAEILGKDDAVNGGFPVTGNCKISGQTKLSEFGNRRLGNGDAVKRYWFSTDLHDVEYCYNEDIVNENHQENVLFQRKSGKGPSQAVDNDGSSASDFEENKVKVSDPVSKLGNLHSEKSMGYESQVDCSNHAPCNETINDGKCNFPSDSSVKSSKVEKNHAGRRDCAGQYSSDNRVEKNFKIKDHYDSDGKMGTLCRAIGKAATQHQLIQDFEDETKAVPEAKSEMSRLFSHFEGEGKQETCVHQLVSVSQQDGVVDGLSLDASGHGHGLKELKEPENAGKSNEARNSLGTCTPDLRGVSDLNASSPGRMNSSSKTASNVLEEAENLRHHADTLKVGREYFLIVTSFTFKLP